MNKIQGGFYRKMTKGKSRCNVGVLWFSRTSCISFGAPSEKVPWRVSAHFLPSLPVRVFLSLLTPF